MELTRGRADIIRGPILFTLPDGRVRLGWWVRCRCGEPVYGSALEGELVKFSCAQCGREELRKF